MESGENKRGGKRYGAGRKKMGRVAINIKIDPDLRERIRVYGNNSDFIDRAIRNELSRNEFYET